METMLQKQRAEDLTTLTEQAQKGSTTSQRQLSAQLRLKLREIIETSSRKQKKDDILQQLYFKMVDACNMRWLDRVYFLMESSHCMRHLLVDEARVHSHYYDTTIAEHISDLPDKDYLIDLDGALQELAGLNEALVKIVECHYFGNMTFPEIALALNSSTKQTKINWLKARGWLYRKMQRKHCVI